jgi:hypothetical protein
MEPHEPQERIALALAALRIASKLLDGCERPYGKGEPLPRYMLDFVNDAIEALQSWE